MTATVHRRHRKDAKLADQRHEERLAALERERLADLARRPADPQPVKQRVPLKERPMLPTKAPWMLDPKAEAAWLRAFVANRSKHHASHSHLHLLVFWRAVGRGVAKAVVRSRDYVVMPDKLKVLVDLAASGMRKDHEDMSARYDRLRKLRVKKARAVGGAAGTLVGGLLLALALWLISGETVPDLGTVLWDLAEALVLLALASTPALAFYGRQPKTARVRPVTAADARAKVEPRPTADVVHAAFGHVGIGDIACEIAPHREGPGWETLVRIPPGPKAFDDVVKVAGALAGNLDVPRDGLFLSPVRGPGGSEKRVRVWWSKTDPFVGDPPIHPALDPRSGAHDPWEDGVRIGVDERGRIVRIPIVDTPIVVIVGRPRTGKTHALLGIGAELAAAPLFDPDCWSFKPSNDFAPLEPLVRAGGGTFRYGTDEATFKAFHQYLVRLRIAIAERNERLATLPIDVNPHGRVERSVATDRANGMRPRPVIADEIQTPLADPKWGGPILTELKEIGRIAPSQNAPLILGFQWVDRKTIEQLDRLVGTRICLSVASHEDSQGALGGAHEPGIAEAHKIPQTATGVAIVAGAIDDPEIGPRGAYRMRHFGIDRRRLADHVARQLVGPRAGQGAPARLSLVKDDDPQATAARASLRQALNGDEALTLKALGERLELGAGAVAAKKAAEKARAAGIEPQRDTTGKVTGSREALYIHRDQLNGH